MRKKLRWRAQIADALGDLANRGHPARVVDFTHSNSNGLSLVPAPQSGRPPAPRSPFPHDRGEMVPGRSPSRGAGPVQRARGSPGAAVRVTARPARRMIEANAAASHTAAPPGSLLK